MRVKFLGDEKLKEDIPRKQKVRFKTTNEKNVDVGWVIKTIIITFTMSAVFNILSSGVMEKVSLVAACGILFAIVMVGIIFDVIGVAVTTADEPPFHSMAARNVKHAERAIMLIKAKDKVSNFCNDVVGDICGIISGSAAAAVVAYVIRLKPALSTFFMSLIITAFVASLTVGGKAAGKSIAIKYSNLIVYNTARIIAFFSFKK